MKVRALVRTDDQATYSERQGWRPVRGDLTEPSSLARVLDGIESVVHAAAYGGKPGPLYQAVNVEGTRELAERALRAGVKHFLQISTVSVYGEPVPPDVDEESPLATEDPEPYCATKARAELELQQVRTKGLPITILRPGMICHWVRSQWGDEMVERIRTRGWPSFLHPDDVMPWVHTENLAEMCWQVLNCPTAPNDAYIAVDRNVAIRDFYGTIAEALGQPIVVPERKPYRSAVRLGKIAGAVDYRPIYTFEETVARLVDLAKVQVP